MSNVSSSRRATEGHNQAGQTLVEFALVIPIIMLLFMAVLEFAVAFNAFIGLNRASQVPRTSLPPWGTWMVATA